VETFLNFELEKKGLEKVSAKSLKDQKRDAENNNDYKKVYELNREAINIDGKILYRKESELSDKEKVKKRIFIKSRILKAGTDLMKKLLEKLKKLEDLSEIYGLDKETIEYALDRNERAHMDYHRESGTVTFIYNVLDLKKDKEYYEAFPMTFIVEHQRLITISNKKNAYVIEQMTRYLESHDMLSIYKFLFASLEIISNAYYPVIEQMDKSKDEVNGLLRQRTTKKNLFALSDLETGMVYLTAAAKRKSHVARTYPRTCPLSQI